MKASTTEVWAAILMLCALVVLMRATYLYAPRQWQPRGALAKALRFAPLVALVAIVVPEVAAPFLADGTSFSAAVLDARVLSAVALLLAARLSGNLLVAIGVGALVLMLR